MLANLRFPNVPFFQETFIARNDVAALSGFGITQAAEHAFCRNLNVAPGPDMQIDLAKVAFLADDDPGEEDDGDEGDDFASDTSAGEAFFKRLTRIA